MGLIKPDWPAPDNVQAVFTTREGGFSSGVYLGLNLGAHVGDDPLLVSKNRQQLQQQLGLQSQPVWLTQVHSTEILQAENTFTEPPVADAAITTKVGLPLLAYTIIALTRYLLVFQRMMFSQFQSW